MNIMFVVGYRKNTRNRSAYVDWKAAGNDILKQFLVESILLSVIGGLIGGPVWIPDS